MWIVKCFWERQDVETLNRNETVFFFLINCWNMKKNMLLVCYLIIIYTYIYNIYIYIDIYGIYHWQVLWSSYRKLAWVGFEPKATEFYSNALTDWAIVGTMSSTHTQIQLSTATPISMFVSYFILTVYSVTSHFILVYICIYILLKQYGNMLLLYINLLILKDILFCKYFVISVEATENITEETTNMVAKFSQNKMDISHWQSTFIVNLTCRE